MIPFLSFSLLLFVSFLFEQSIILPLGLSPGVFFIPFFVYVFGLFSLERVTGWWFVLGGATVAGIFSVSPLFSFVSFVCAGAFFLFVKPLLPVERVFSFFAALWSGILAYMAALFLVWSSVWLIGFLGAVPFSSFISSLASIALFAFGALIPVSVLRWLFLYRKRNKQSYVLR